MPAPLYTLRGKFPLLRELGLAAEHLPAWDKPTFTTPHTHDIVEMFFVLGGSGHNRQGGVDHKLGPGSFSTITLEETHDIISAEGALDVVNLYIDPERIPIPELPSELARFLPVFLPLQRRLLARAQRRVHLSFADPSRPAFLLRALLEEQHERRPGFQDAMYQYFRLFILECARLLAHQDTGEPSDDLSRPAASVERLLADLDRDLHRPQRLQEWAQRLRLSPNYLCRIFKERTGLSLFDYIARRRVQRAMILLRGSDRRILDIALECGFRDLSYFNRKFAALAGLPPGAYRQRAGTGGARSPVRNTARA